MFSETAHQKAAHQIGMVAATHYPGTPCLMVHWNQMEGGMTDQIAKAQALHVGLAMEPSEMA